MGRLEEGERREQRLGYGCTRRSRRGAKAGPPRGVVGFAFWEGALLMPRGGSDLKTGTSCRNQNTPPPPHAPALRPPTVDSSFLITEMGGAQKFPHRGLGVVSSSAGCTVSLHHHYGQQLDHPEIPTWGPGPLFGATGKMPLRALTCHQSTWVQIVAHVPNRTSS